MIVYFDSSSLVKLYVAESHSDAVREWVERCRVAATSRVARPEILSALARRMRDGSMGPADTERAVSAFERDWEAFSRIDLDEDLAGALALKHALRGFDAIHLAAALGVPRLGPGSELRFSAFDARLNAAASAEGLEVIEPLSAGS